MTKIWYDTEFFDDGSTIDLISIGMVNENDDKLYLIDRDIDLEKMIRHADGWMLNNVAPHLPLAMSKGKLVWNSWHPDHDCLRKRWQIAEQVRSFINQAAEGDKDPELWAWYAAYDHVALAQLWGPMSDLPAGVPMFTMDVKQEFMRMGNPEAPSLDAGKHHALSDAQECRFRHEWLMAEESRRLEQWAR